MKRRVWKKDRLEQGTAYFRVEPDSSFRIGSEPGAPLDYEQGADLTMRHARHALYDGAQIHDLAAAEQPDLAEAGEAPSDFRLEHHHKGKHRHRQKISGDEPEPWKIKSRAPSFTALPGQNEQND